LTFMANSNAAEPDKFGPALLFVAAIEIAAIFLFTFKLPEQTTPVQPSVIKLQIIAPAPTPKAPTPPPKPPPVPTPKTPTPPPLPKAVQPPPLPIPPPRQPNHPTVRSHPRPVIHSQPRPPAPATPPPPTPVLPQAPVSAAPPPTPEQQQSAIARYTGLVRSIVLSHLVVPQQMIDNGFEGTCTLHFTLAPDGTLESVSIETASGFEQANEAAITALRASHMPAFLSGMPKHAQDFTLPVTVSGNDDN
jgi:TonB family protein